MLKFSAWHFFDLYIGAITSFPHPLPGVYNALTFVIQD